MKSFIILVLTVVAVTVIIGAVIWTGVNTFKAVKQDQQDIEIVKIVQVPAVVASHLTF